MEVGPLARLLVGYGKGKPKIKEVVDEALKKLDVPVTALFSTLGRTAARGLETRLVARWIQEFYNELIDNLKGGDMQYLQSATNGNLTTWPAECEGVGLSEAPRGALAHWIRIKDRKIDNYQLVVPSTWNASPRDVNGKRSAYEEALIGTPVAKRASRSRSSGRSIHSIRVWPVRSIYTTPDGKHIHQVTVN